MADYYYLIESEVCGPYSLSDCFALLDQGTLRESTMVCRGGQEDWRPLKGYAELHGHVLHARNLAQADARRHRDASLPGRIALAVILAAAAILLLCSMIEAGYHHQGLRNLYRQTMGR